MRHNGEEGAKVPTDANGRLSVSELVASLSSKDAAVRRSAEEMLRDLSPESFSELLEAANRDVDYWRENGFRWYYFYIQMPPIFVLLMFNLPGFHLLRFLCSLAVMMPLSMLWGRFVSGRAERKMKIKPLGAALARFDDVRAIRPLIMARAFREKHHRDTIESALIRLLPRLRIEDADLLDDLVRANLNRVLVSPASGRENEALVLAVLKAYEQIGDKRSLAMLEKLVDGKGAAKDNPAIQSAAEECLLYIRERLTSSRSEKILLRASGSSDGTEPTLLRPAQGEVESDARLLLRPGEASDPSTNVR